MAIFAYPTAAELVAIAQDKMPRLTQDRPIFDLMPIRNVANDLLIWDQLDNFTGLQNVRGIDGQPARVSRVGQKRYISQPGVYGEYFLLDELELTRRAQLGTFATPVNIEDLVMQAQDQGLQRMLDRLELIGWTLLTSGTFSVSAPNGAVVHTDSYTLQTFTSSTTWATAATSTPLADLRAIKLKHRGHSVDFGRKATLYVNQVTANNLLLNTNSNDLFGRRQNGLSTINNLNEVNTLLAGDDLPQIAVYDEGYLNDSGTFVPFISDNAGVLVGARPAGQSVAEYRMTTNINNPNGAPGMYMKVFDRGEDQVPRNIEVHLGHNGGPVIYYPSAVVACTF